MASKKRAKNELRPSSPQSTDGDAAGSTEPSPELDSEREGGATEPPIKPKRTRRPYPDTVEAPPPGMQPSTVLSLPIAPGAKATPAQVLSTLELAVASYRALLRSASPSSYARVEGVLTGLEMARALCAMLVNK